MQDLEIEVSDVVHFSELFCFEYTVLESKNNSEVD